jgi:hypothetical protein
METGQIASAAIAQLQAAGIPASWEYPGHISIEAPDYLILAVGTADGFWGYDVHDKRGFDRTPPYTPEMATIKDILPENVTPEQLVAAVQSVLAKIS